MVVIIDGLDLCVRNGDLLNDFDVETIIGKCFDGNNKVEWLVKWMACGLCEATWVPLINVYCPNFVRVCEAQWRGEQQTPQQKHQCKVMVTLDGTTWHTHNVLMIGAKE